MKLSTVRNWVARAILIAGLPGLAGGEQLITEPEALAAQARLSFRIGQTLRYRFVSEREIEILWDVQKNDPNATSQVQELLTLDVAYNVDVVEPNGTASITATCESIQVRRSRTTGGMDTRPDAVEAARDKRFGLRVEAGGRILDYGPLKSLIREMGAAPFRDHPQGDKIKSPEMIWDFIALQWSPWEVLAGSDQNWQPGTSWTSLLPVPTPWVSRKARTMKYTCQNEEDTATGRVAIVSSVQTLSPEKAPSTWPVPYGGTFRQSGTFGFLMGHKIESLSGQGTDRFNLDTGQSLGYEHRYKLVSRAFMPMNYTAGARVTIRQTLRMDRLD